MASRKDLKFSMRVWLAGAVLAAGMTGAAPAGVMNPIAGDPVAIDAGKVSGTLLPSGIRAYFGIPFAAPPLRENRWRAPQPVAHWSGIYNADRKQAECVQPLRAPTINHYFGDELAGEDCLYLNVWAPAQPAAKRAVLVWIYGGAFNLGSGASPIYDGEALAKKGVIYVSINYRLVVFGFLAHPELTRETGHNASGDWGFLDQVAALKWVQRNIAAFGGDPANVTLIGQSAGAMSINDLQASPLAKGLFARVIGFSGSTLPGGAGAGVPLADAEAQGMKLQSALKAANLAQMRGLSADKVVAAGGRASPDIDGYFLPDTVENIFAAGKQSDVAVLTGSTANDIGTTPPIRKAASLAQYEELARQMFGARSEEFLKLYPARSDSQALAQADQVGRNSGFALGARNWARAQTRTGKQPAYLYLLSRVQPFTPGVSFSDFDPATAGAYHMGDVPYWLGTYDAFNIFRTTRNWTPWDRELSDDMQDVVIAFARSGNPSTAKVKFAPYDPANETRVDFGDSIKTEKLYSKGLDFLNANPAAAPRSGNGGRSQTAY